MGFSAVAAVDCIGWRCRFRLLEPEFAWFGLCKAESIAAIGLDRRRFDGTKRFEQQSVAPLSKFADRNYRRLNLVSVRASGNAASIDRLEAQIIQVDKATQRRSGRLDTLIDEFGQSRTRIKT